MPFANITGMTVGQDLRLVMFTPVAIAAGVAAPQAGFSSDQLGRLAGFNATPVISEVSGVPLDNGGVRIVRNIYQGWNGDIDFMRYNGNLSLMMASIMGVFNQLGNETYFQIDAVVYNVITQTTDTYTFQNCVISQVDLGRFGETGRVDQRLHFEGQNMLINGAFPSSFPSFTNVAGGTVSPLT